MPEINYRMSQESDKSAILSLFEACFGEARNPSRWSWQYENADAPAIVVVAEASGMIVGHYAVLPRLLSKGGEPIKAGLVVDVMTHPAYGRRGIFTQSALTAFAAARASEIVLLIGFPNEAAIRGHRKVGWHEIGSARVFAHPIRLGMIVSKTSFGRRIPALFLEFLDILSNAYSSLLARRSRSLDYDVTDVSYDEFTKLLSSVRNLVEEGISHDRIVNAHERNWLAWRIGESPNSHCMLAIRKRNSDSILGYAILKFKQLKGVDTCIVLDILVSNQNDAARRILVREMIRRARVERCEICLFLGNPITGFSPSLLVFPTPKRLRFIARSLSNSPIPSELLDLDNWCIQFIDHDVP